MREDSELREVRGVAMRGTLKWFGDEEGVGGRGKEGVGVTEEEEAGVREEEGAEVREEEGAEVREEGVGAREEVEGAGTPLLRGGEEEVGVAVLWGWLSVGFREESRGRMMTGR